MFRDYIGRFYFFRREDKRSEWCLPPSALGLPEHGESIKRGAASAGNLTGLESGQRKGLESGQRPSSNSSLPNISRMGDQQQPPSPGSGRSFTPNAREGFMRQTGRMAMFTRGSTDSGASGAMSPYSRGGGSVDSLSGFDVRLAPLLTPCEIFFAAMQHGSFDQQPPTLLEMHVSGVYI